ncbi:ATP-binding protein [Actinomycetospora sp. TBRC 11914]|uniref:Dph6-related ATP pyrophosphatase n=1 Tax=Actinomycetospora sp. TBRC 11914 TaxID=2729387 RepID=UPI00145EC4C3|nr:ATP-binding protein [Actinomycetospora sp. TBRC 11914]NMO92985.1 ATP-binding protein [Actinomycetospora sp. TBRC 11914]
MARRRAWGSWSCGKDGAFALAETRARGDVDVAGLMTTLDASAGEVAMSRVPTELLRRQAAALDLPLHLVELPWPCPNEVYEERTGAAWAQLRRDGADEVVFGDLFLADVRAYRERSLDGTGVAARFPLWERPTGDLAAGMLAAGLRAVVVCVDPAQAPASLAGRPWDADLLRELPDGVDPCGENGEFHTFVTDGPGFARPVDVVVGDVAEHDGFVYAPLCPDPD